MCIKRGSDDDCNITRKYSYFTSFFDSLQIRIYEENEVYERTF